MPNNPLRHIKYQIRVFFWHFCLLKPASIQHFKIDNLGGKIITLLNFLINKKKSVRTFESKEMDTFRLEKKEDFPSYPWAKVKEYI